MPLVKPLIEHRQLEKQKAILRAIEEHWLMCEYGPSIREIQSATGISSSSVVAYCVRKLADAGYVEYAPHVARSIRLRRAS